MTTDDLWRAHTEAFGEYLRTQRRLAELSLRELAAQANVSNAYLSQIERGLHQPSVRVLRAIAEALGLPPEGVFAKAGMFDQSADRDATAAAEVDVEAAIRAEDRLTAGQKQALISVFRSYVGSA